MNDQNVLQANLVYVALSSDAIVDDARLCISALAQGAALLQNNLSAYPSVGRSPRISCLRETAEEGIPSVFIEDEFANPWNRGGLSQAG